jgi:hypothetical protein
VIPDPSLSETSKDGGVIERETATAVVREAHRPGAVEA